MPEIEKRLEDLTVLSKKLVSSGRGYVVSGFHEKKWGSLRCSLRG
jgi:hypothetical protein